MSLKAEASVYIQKPISEVFDAVYNPQKLQKYFTTKMASAPLEAGTTVQWEFADFPGAFPVQVKECVLNKKIVVGWEAGENAGYNTNVTFDFSEVSAQNTLVKISEEGWKDEQKELPNMIGNSKGWMNMACCMKAYVEYGINLRQGFFK